MKENDEKEIKGRKFKKTLDIKDKVLLSLLLGRKGGKTTMRIIDKIIERPYNANQLSNILHVDYNTVTFHVNLLEEHGYVESIQFGNTFIIHPSDKLNKSYDEYLIIKEKLENE